MKHGPGGSLSQSISSHARMHARVRRPRARRARAAAASGGAARARRHRRPRQARLTQAVPVTPHSQRKYALAAVRGAPWSKSAGA